MTADATQGLALPDPPSQTPPEYRSRPRDEDRPTRRPLGWWDRVKFLILLLGGWLVLVWATDVEFRPLITWSEAFRRTASSGAWLLILAGIEVLRQAHFLISEHSAAYHRFWTKGVVTRWDRRLNHMNSWTRYRVSRALKVLFVLVIIDLALAKIFGVSAFTAFFTLPARLVSALPFVFQMLLYLFLLVFQFVGLFFFLSRGGVDVYFPDDIKTRFSDVWGQDSVLGKVQENMVFLEDPESIEDKGGYVPGGILLWGPPGTGKTLMAEAVAGETGRPFVFVDPGAFINMFMGVGILKVKALFRKLRKLALRYGGVIAFFDEADSLGNRGALAPPGVWGQMGGAWADRPPCNGLSYLSPESAWMVVRGGPELSAVEPRRGPVRDRIIAGLGGGGVGGMGTLQSLLSEISGLKKPRGFFNRVIRRALGMRPKPPPKYRILIMMATNMPQALDEALLRPGRIDRIYKVGYPSKAGRIRTYQGYLDKVHHRLTDEQVDKLATITPYATGASIKDIVNESLINAIRDGRDEIEWRDVVKAKQLKDLGPPEDVEYVDRERHAVAIHEACHAVTAYRMRKHLLIDIATIEKGGTYLGMVASIPPEDQFTRWRSEYEADVMVSLASLAGERIFFAGDSSSGVSGDLEGATRIATQMEGYWGMGSTVASHGVTHEVGIGGGGKPGAGERKEQELLEGSLGYRIEGKLAELLARTETLLAHNRHAILAVAHALEANKTVTGEDVEAIIEGRAGPLIDGRPYQSAAFLEGAETYHRGAMIAHRDHAEVGMALPILTATFEPDAAGEAAPDADGSSPNGEEPVAEDPVAEDPVAEDPVVDEPVASSPAHDMPPRPDSASPPDR